ncbi:TRAP transporter small permease [Chloroflexota bacterium]
MKRSKTGSVEHSKTYADRYMEWIARVMVAPAAVLLFGWVFVFTAYVISRQVLGGSFLFVEEYTMFWLVVVGYFGILYTFVTGHHVVVEFGVRALPPRAARMVTILTNLLACAVAFYMTWRGIELFQREFARRTVTTSGLQTPFWPFILLMVIAVGLFAVAIVLDTWRHATGQGRHPDLSREPDEETEPVERTSLK